MSGMSANQKPKKVRMMRHAFDRIERAAPDTGTEEHQELKKNADGIGFGIRLDITSNLSKDPVIGCRIERRPRRA